MPKESQTLSIPAWSDEKLCGRPVSVYGGMSGNIFRIVCQNGEHEIRMASMKLGDIKIKDMPLKEMTFREWIIVGFIVQPS